MTAALFSVSSLRDFEVYDRNGDRLGTIVDVMLSVEESRVLYAALAYEDERGAKHNKLVAVPITSLRLDPEDECFVLGVERRALATVAGFDAAAPPAQPDASLASCERPSSRAARVSLP
jgi:sporulation protein YlmC with PRC-barrel domain